MRIALIAHGNMPIRRQGWGAVEGTIWQKVQHLRRRGHTVDVYNSRAIDEVVAQVDDGSYDFVHCHNERFASACNERLRSPFALTSHDPYLYGMAREDELRCALGREPSAHLPRWFADTLHVPANLVLSPPIASLYRRHGYGGSSAWSAMRLKRSAFARPLSGTGGQSVSVACPRGSGKHGSRRLSKVGFRSTSWVRVGPLSPSRRMTRRGTSGGGARPPCTTA